jgi:hypothetical protein
METDPANGLETGSECAPRKRKAPPLVKASAHKAKRPGASAGSGGGFVPCGSRRDEQPASGMSRDVQGCGTPNDGASSFQMSLFAKLNEAAAGRGLAFLVIGGHAVIAHGFQRGTEDADILACKDERALWLQALFERHGNPEIYERIVRLFT